jgi:hypothetical protein
VDSDHPSEITWSYRPLEATTPRFAGCRRTVWRIATAVLGPDWVLLTGSPEFGDGTPLGELPDGRVSRR